MLSTTDSVSTRTFPYSLPRPAWFYPKILVLSPIACCSADDASNMFHYCGDNRKELQQLSRGVVSYKDAEGKLQFLQLNIRGAGDGAHLPVPPRPAPHRTWPWPMGFY